MKRTRLCGLFVAACLFGFLPLLRAEPELEGAFIFGSRDLACEVPNAPGTNYTVVHHVNGQPDLIEYDAGAGYGYEVIDPGNTGRNGFARFGPFDDSANSRDAFDDTCPEEIYDSFIGFKDFTNTCSEAEVGDRDSPCSTVMAPEGGIFRVDVPNGFYRFVAAVGEAENRHAHRLLAEDGGSGPPPMIGANYVVLVSNYNQADHGAGVFGRVGFLDKLPPTGDGVPPDPRFVNMDENGMATNCCPNSPVLEVTQGYIRIHQLQGNSNDGAAGDRDANGGDIVLLELWKVDSGDIGAPVCPADVVRAIDPDPFAPGDEVTVTLTATNVTAGTTILETFPAGWGVADDGGGVVSENTITFTIDADGDVVYRLESPGDATEGGTFSGTVVPGAGCFASVGGDDAAALDIFPCEPEPEDPAAELVAAFGFGSRDLPCTSENDPGVTLTMVHHTGGGQADADALEYDPGRGWGFEVLNPGATGRGTFARFGPFDDSPNGRNRFPDTCPEELYDSFIGWKSFANTCSAAQVGNMEDPCDTVMLAEGGVFRIDVPNGTYRFVAAIGEADNPHAHRVLAEDGGTGPPEDIGDHVVLVHNHDQAQYDIGEARGDCPGCGVFARVGFNCRVPPVPDGVAPDPKFINMGPDGKPLGPGDDGIYGTMDDPPPESPALVVTQGYIRIHMVQGNSNDGPGGKNFDPGTGMGDRDPNGGDIVMLELWRVPEVAPPPPEIASIDPVEGPTTGGTAVTITGQNFQDGAVVRFGGQPAANVTVVSATEITCETPPGAEGSVDVEVENPDTQKDTLAAAFTYVLPPKLFIRGDTEPNNVYNIADGIQILERLFTGRQAFGSNCDEAGDANADGQLDVGDAIWMFNFLFGGGNPPPAPSPDCGSAEIRVGCERSSPGCP